jgi:rod shape-determining protein MreD
MRRGVLLGLLVPGLVIVHFLLHLGLGLGREAPDLLTLALLLAAREVGMGGGAALGFFFGLLEDAFSILAFGANTLALTLVGILGAGTRHLLVGESLRFLFLYLAGGKLLRNLVYWVGAGEGVREPFVEAVLIQGSVSALYLGVVGLLLFLPFGGREALP